MLNQYDKLKSILREMFQMDQSDLDFGIYRIMNAKREEIESFLDKELLPQVTTEFAKYRGTEIEEKKKSLTLLKRPCAKAGRDGEKYDAQFKVVFDTIRKLMAPPPEPKKENRLYCQGTQSEV